MSTFWCAHAQLPDRVHRGVRLHVVDGVITQLETRCDPGPEDVRLPGLVLPGLANAHSHAFHRALRGRTHDAGGNFWSWRDEMYAVAAHLNPDSYLDLVRATFLEMLLAGWSVVGEFHYLHHQAQGQPYDDPNAMGRAVIQAADEVGIRLTLLDTCYLQGGLGPEGYRPLDDIQRRFADRSAAAWAERVNDLPGTDLQGRSRCRVGAAAHSIRALNPRQLADFGEATEGWIVHAHVSEQPAENAAAQAFLGMSPTEALGEAGLLDEYFTAVHDTHLTDRDRQLMSVSGARACLCPTTERDLADGIGPARDLHDRGVGLCLGSDQNAVVDPFEEIRGLEMNERLWSGERGRFDLSTLISAASAQGYAALGWAHGGKLTVGSLADFIAVRTDSSRTVGSALPQIVFAASASDVTDVVVGGRHVVTQGRHALGRVEDLMRAALRPLRDRRG